MASRNDKLFQKRKAKNKSDLARRKAQLSERRRILIVCEGEKTEPLYLNALKVDMGLTTAEVEVCGECGSAPESVVEFGKGKLVNDPDFEFVFFVFDRDCHKNYDKAIQLISEFQSRKICKGKTISAITSVPCFEIWFLLHFERHTRPYNAGGNKSPCGNLISVLKQKQGFEDYQKGNKKYFDFLRGRLEQAKINAAKTLEDSQNSGDAEHHGNPTTLMHKLIEALEEIAKDHKTRN